MKVGVFDSGVGGLTVAKALQASQRFSELVYYCDTARVPYGSKDSNTVTRYALEAVEFFNGVDVDFLVVACNTVSVVALQEMQRFSNKPVYGVLEPGVLALEQLAGAHHQDPVLIIATQSTIRSGEYQRRIQALGFNNVMAMATPLFVPIVEEGLYSGSVLNAAFEHYFSPMQALPDWQTPKTIVLGCTHYPLIAAALSQHFAGAKTIHSGEAMMHWLEQHCDLQQQFDHTELTILASENVDGVKRVAERWGLLD